MMMPTPHSAQPANRRHRLTTPSPRNRVNTAHTDEALRMSLSSSRKVGEVVSPYHGRGTTVKASSTWRPRLPRAPWGRQLTRSTFSPRLQKECWIAVPDVRFADCSSKTHQGAVATLLTGKELPGSSALGTCDAHYTRDHC
jgi:hypothetical protein